MNRKLKDFSDDELLEEIAARRNSHQGEREPVKFCDNCVHFRPYKKGGEAPEDWKLCAHGHTMAFRSPRSFADVQEGEWGHYRRVCGDREEEERP